VTPTSASTSAALPTPRPSREAREKSEAREAKASPPVLDNYVVRRVYNGMALVEGRRGMVEVEPGTNLPGAGQVEEIRRQGRQWVVVTTKGLIKPE
jgi:hypothetical protein